MIEICKDQHAPKPTRYGLGVVRWNPDVLTLTRVIQHKKTEDLFFCGPVDREQAQKIVAGIQRWLGTSDTPDIRPASELTQDRLEAWEWWVFKSQMHWPVVVKVVGTYVSGIDDPVRWVETERGDRRHRNYSTAEIEYAYPIHDGQPWRPASWAEVDETAKARTNR